MTRTTERGGELSEEGRRMQLDASRRAVGRSWGRSHPQRWQAVSALDPDGTILDVGCSNGSYVERLRDAGRTAWGTDVLADDGWNRPVYFQSDAAALPLRSDAVDYVVAFEVLEHLPRPVEHLTEFRRVARRKLVLSVPNCEVPEAMRRSGVTFHHWVDPTHENFFTRESLAAALSEAGLSATDMKLINPIRPELLLLLTWRMPRQIVEPLARWLERIPGRRELPMTILATATVD
jgi:SAM-dependent methyltransferase